MLNVAPDGTRAAILAAPEAPDSREDLEGGFDEAAESAFLAEARDRGELPTRAQVMEERTAETDRMELPPLDELVKRIPENVRETLDDLFRARFVRVQKVPARALKQ